MEDYTCLLNEAMPTNYALVYEAYTVQMHISSWGEPERAPH